MVRTVSVIIPARDDAGNLEAAVQSVVMQVGAVVGDCIIAVGPSLDETGEVAQRLATDHEIVKVIDNPTGNIPNALNLAVAAAAGEVVVRVDAHCELPSDYIANALETMVETGAANVVAVQVPRAVNAKGQAIAAAMSHVLGSGGAAYRTGTRPGRVETGYLGVFDRPALESVGGWDESFLRNEDYELNCRLNALEAAGGVWLDPRLRVAYRPRTSLTALAVQYWRYGRWRALTARKHPRDTQLRQLAAPLLLVALVSSLLWSVFVSGWAFVVPAAYVCAVIVAGLATPSLGVRQRLRMSAALGTMHLCWGAGFVSSLVVPPRRR